MKFLYYSTQTALSHKISIRYYRSKFYVYCAEQFEPENPGSSNPAALEQIFRAIAVEQDRGNTKVIVHKDTLKKVAARKKREGEITQGEFDALLWELKTAETIEFRPLIYLILRNAVKEKIHPVPVNERANPDAIEYIIEGLNRDEFEIAIPRIELKGTL